MNNIMLDLETMSTKPNAAIVSIGAVRFDTQLRDEFYCVVDLQSCEDAGLVMDSGSILWWLRQGGEARSIFRKKSSVLGAAIDKFSSWVGEYPIVWGNGASFDNVILESAYEAMKVELPWKYWNNRCYRTIKNMHPEVKMKRIGVHHDALDDAKSQAEHLIRILGR